MVEERMDLPHTLTLNDRKQLTMTGVCEVISFDDTAVILRTTMGTLTVQGSQLQLKTLSPPVVILAGSAALGPYASPPRKPFHPLKGSDACFPEPCPPLQQMPPCPSRI